MHSEALNSEISPLSQSTHSEALIGANFPASQYTHDAPDVFETDPVGHKEHKPGPKKLLKNPSGHGVHGPPNGPDAPSLQLQF